MRKRFLPVVLAMAVLGFALPARGVDLPSANFCTSVNVCMNFVVADYTPPPPPSINIWAPWLAPAPLVTGFWYSLAVTYVSGPYADALAGGVTAAGIYDEVSGGPTLTFQSIIDAPDGQTWGPCGANDLNPPIVLLCAGAASGAPAVEGLGPTETLQFAFTSSEALTADMFGADGELGFRAHLQGFGPGSCSLKPDSRIEPSHLVGGEASAAGCGTPGSTVPEPVTMLLLASGLGGIALPALRRLRRKDEEV